MKAIHSLAALLSVVNGNSQMHADCLEKSDLWGETTGLVFSDEDIL